MELGTLTHPEYLTFFGPDGAPCRGARQEWFRDRWQRQAGCGPTTAATLLAYLSAAHPALAALAPMGYDFTSFLSYMEAVWQDVTPGPRGLDSLGLFTQGSLRFARRRGIALDCRELEIPGFKKLRPPLSQCTDFLRSALSGDCPVGFLNFSNGSLTNLEDWHWVPLISLRQESSGALLCAVLDGGEEKTVDFALWHATTRLGGGLTALLPGKSPGAAVNG